MTVSKTNAIRQIEAKKRVYALYEYEAPEGFLDGVSVAKSIGKPVEMVYKTLVAQGSSKEHYVFIIPVEKELDLKMAAKSVGEKKMDMIPSKEITNITGYVKGGCSPIGMKKPFKTVIHLSAKDMDRIIVSGGRVGLQVEIRTSDLMELSKARMECLVSE